ncbi:LysM peptidoglycan-binding domain-containing protein [Lacunisphaera limnophila]|uniref:LysM peptidoglycan-binding domain-containing protein n=1 Tax=Lacunisphaera limnophila TaxID=1838286 RepID=UPI0014708AC6|nr:LysM peptidoglycan-binding domain-containing protein [Lacunisphaera limnophila]
MGLLLGLLLLPGVARAQPAPDLATLRTRATGGDLEAQNALGNAHTNALLGLSRDFAEAFKWYRQAGDKGFAPAQFNLGLAYELGRGVAADERQAFKYYLMSAEQGFAPAQFNVGNMYASGRGIAQDLFEANLWYKQAAENGLVEAQFNLGLVYETGRGVKKDDGLAARWYRTAAERGYPRAQYNYALLLEEGRGVAKDAATAALLYRAAAEQGFAPAQVNYGVLLAEGRDGISRDPIQAYVWLSRAVQNGATPEARDALAATLTPEQLAAAQQAGGARVVSAAPVALPAGAPPAATGGDARVGELSSALAQAREANSRLAEANQRLEVENARLADEVARAGGSSPLVEQLRAQSSRLAEQVQALTADKEASERQAALLAAQVKDAEHDLALARSAGSATASPVPAVDVAAYESRIATLSARLEEATSELKALQTAHADLLAANQQLQRERDTLASAQPANASPAAATVDANALATLQRDNARLNEEVKRATVQLLALNRQLRAQTRAGGTAAEPAPDLTALNTRVQAATEEAARLQDENRRLAGRVAELESQPKPTTDDSLAPQLAQARQEAMALSERITGLLEEKAALETKATSWEQKATEALAASRGAGENEAALRRQLEDLQARLVEQDQAQARHLRDVAALTADNQALTERLARAETQLRQAASQTVSNDQLTNLQQELAASRSRTEELGMENRRLAAALAEQEQGGAATRARIEALEQELAAARTTEVEAGPELDRLRTALAAADRRAEILAAANTDLQGQLNLAQGAAATTDSLRRELIQANQALEKNAATTAELTAANQRLEGELAAAARQGDAQAALRDELAQARQDLAELTTLRESNSRLTAELARTTAARTPDAASTRELENLTTALGDSRRDLASAQARVADLEQALAEALTVRTRGTDDQNRVMADRDEANRTVEKLTAAVTELTAENQKLEQDLDNAQKSVAAALAAQSQAESAASPDAYQMEISTLNARLKQLETQVEEERSGAAREITTLAAQLQRTRETNRSLTEANRALLSAKESETAADRDAVAGLEGRVRELTAANEEMRRQAAQQVAELRAATGERDGLRAELADARQVAKVLPGLSDEKLALQERLEAVGGQLVTLQRDHEELEKVHAELNQQLLASQQVAEKSGADLAALQARVAAAEQADANHTESVAELTQTNQRLEQEREDMRRLVDSYRADIARLTQSVRTAEQLRTEAERGGQQNVDALAAQLAQVRREVEAARSGQARLTESYAAQERERQAIITQLRTENGALVARLNQAQGTLDQIAAAARLGTPASTIAAGGTPPVRPLPVPANEGRTHTVAEGDSLSRISLRYYGTPNRWQEIFQANRDVLQGSSALRVGMQLRIP